jgi:putative ABC transport system permease protein
MVQVGGIYCTIVGVAKKLSNLISIGTDLDRSILLPINAEQLMYNKGDQIDLCCITLKDEYPVSERQEQVLNIIKEHHYVHPDDKSALFCINLSDLVTAFKLLFRGLDILLWIVGCGSLLAGLIGISNIMLVTVKERTQEIGIRRALGAKPQTIVRQILAESLVLTASAGIVGLMTGVWLLRLAGKIIEANPLEDYPLGNPQISFSVALAATCVIVLGGLLAGWMPARRAMKIKAIEALREE